MTDTGKLEEVVQEQVYGQNESFVDPNVIVVDVHFIQVNVKGGADRDNFRDAFVGAMGDGMNLNDMAQGPSFSALAEWLGSQILALYIMALGQAHGLWAVQTPGQIGMTGEAADKAAVEDDMLKTSNVVVGELVQG